MKLKSVLTSLLVVAVLVVSSSAVLIESANIAEPQQYARSLVLSGNCTTKCGDRCSATKHLAACVKFCRICCLKCKCVPLEGKPHQKRIKCPCYTNMKNSKGLPKCP